MFGVAAVVSFIISLLFQVWSVSHGHINWQTFMVLGLIFLAAHLTWKWYPWRHA